MSKKSIYFTAFLITILILTVVFLTNMREDFGAVQPVNEPSETVTEWAEYENDEFDFRIAYPSELTMVILDPTESNPRLAPGLENIGGTVFVASGPGVMGVKTYSTPKDFDLEKWLHTQNSRLQYEDRRTIAGKDAIIMHAKGDDESFPNEKRAYLVTEEYIFEILTSFNDDMSKHTTVWDSFKLLE